MNTNINAIYLVSYTNPSLHSTFIIQVKYCAITGRYIV